ncbi:MAG TPA: peptidylprolyl isomerase [Terriglobia bacterium]|nr:peptidylprolyl isomerase [Terriglobia bacterium]
MKPLQMILKLECLCILTVGLALSASAQNPTPMGPSSPSPAGSVPNSSTTSGKSEPTAAAPVSPEAVVIKMGELQITAREVNRILETMPPQFRPFYSGPGRRQLADVLISNKLLYQEAEKRKLAERDSVSLDLKISQESILTSAVRNEMEAEVSVTDEALQKFLNENSAKYEEAKVRRIVVCSSNALSVNPNQQATNCPALDEAHAKADDIRKKLMDGADFEEMAAKFSADSLSSGKGGDLGYIRRGHQMPLIVPPVEKVIFSIPLGTISEVIPSAFGFEIVKVEDRRLPKLQDVRKELEPLYRRQKVDDTVKEWKSHQPISLDETFFAPKQMIRPVSTKK